MTVRDELERLIEYGRTIERGPALLAMVEDAERYRWLRGNLQHINFDGLTCDTSDIGLDYAIDKARAGK